MLKRVALLMAGAAVFSGTIRAQAPPECRKVAVDLIALNGANHLPPAFQERLMVSLRHREFSECSNWIGEVESMVVHAEDEAWPRRENEGYLGLGVGAEWRPLREEKGVLHVSVTIRVDEGQQKKLGRIEFRAVGAHVTPPSAAPLIALEDLRELIPLRDGEVFNRGRLYDGLRAVAQAYGARGYIDCSVSTNMEVDPAGQAVSVTVDLDEGPQYHVGRVAVAGLEPEMAAVLRAQLPAGSPANPRLIEDFFSRYKSRLPPGSSPRTAVWQRDKQRAVVDFSFDFRIAFASQD